MAATCANKKTNDKRCPCTYSGCDKHGICCECVAFHGASGEIPGCFFTRGEERTYDRSVATFVSGRR